MANMTQTQTRHDARPTTPRPEPIAGTRPEPRQVPIAGTRPRQSASAGELVLAYLRIQAGVLSSLEPMVRADEPDAVHQMRVATRRLRAAFRSFGTVIPRSRSEKVAGELKWLGGLLGPVRDGEVLPRHLQASLRTVPVELLIGPVQARVQGHFPPRRAAAYAELIEALDSPRYAALLAELDRLTLEPPLGPQAEDPAREVLPAAVRRAHRQANKRMHRARPGMPPCIRPGNRPAERAMPPRPPARRPASQPASSPGR
jgi:CHAD domain-containing protein